MFAQNKPIMCQPKYVVKDHFMPRPQPIIHPVVHVNRLNIVDVPKHIYKPVTKNVVVEHRPPFHCCW